MKFSLKYAVHHRYDMQCKSLNQDIPSIYYHGALIPAATVCQIISNALANDISLPSDFVQILDKYLPATAPDENATYKFYVSTTGSDSNSGSSTHPFATLEKARDAIRELNTVGFPGATVYVRGGTYELSESFALTEADSGTAEAPIIYQAAGAVVITGGKTVTNFVPLSESNPVYNRFAEAARSHIMQADLTALGITDYGAVTWDQSFLGLVFDGVPMTLARWPNVNEVVDGITGWEKITAVVSPTAPETVPNQIRYATSRPDEWATPDPLNPIWIRGYFIVEYFDSCNKLSSIDTGTKTLTIDKTSQNLTFWNDEYAAWSTSVGRFFYENVLEELNSPGEYYLDRATGILYFYPPSPIMDNAVVSTLTAPFVTLTNSSYITLKDLKLNVNRDNGVVMTGGGNNTIDNCEIFNAGKTGIMIKASSSNTISNCDIAYTGGGEISDANEADPRGGGIGIDAGNYTTLVPGNNLIYNNKIHDIGTRRRGSYSCGVLVKGVGNKIKNNLIYNTPSLGIWIFGNDHEVEYNELHNVCQSTNDVAAIYINTAYYVDRWYCYGYSFRGNSISYNYIHDTYRDPATAYSGQYSIYVDDIASGTTIVGNILNKVSQGIFGCNGGRDNRVENNIVILDTAYSGSGRYGALMNQCAFTSFLNSYDPTRTWLNPNTSQWVPIYNSSLHDELVHFNYQNPPYNKYSNLSNMWSDQPQHAKHCTVLSNVVCVPQYGTPIEYTWMMNGAPDENNWAMGAILWTGHLNDPPTASYIETYIRTQNASYRPALPDNPDTLYDNDYDYTTNSLYTEVHTENNYQVKYNGNTLASVKLTSGATIPNQLSDFELLPDSPMWAKGWVRIPIELIGYTAP